MIQSHLNRKENKQATRKRTTQKEETNKRDYESHNETNGAKPLQKL